MFRANWRHDKRIILAGFAGISVLILLAFVGVAYIGAEGRLLMPLDDVYIHFQYARQLASGQAYVYNPGQAPTSGATSFLYPYVLAAGYVIGFRGLWLGLWAMLIGTLALFAAMIAVYRLCQAMKAPQWLAFLTTITFALSGSIAWHFMSGMETGVMIALTLWALLLVIEKRLMPFVVVATLLTLTRPEGGLMAGVASVTLLLRLWGTARADDQQTSPRWQWLALALPILALGIQPIVNGLITGSTVATGNQAKSILATVPPDWGVIITRILDNYVRIWREWLTGTAPAEGLYLPPLLSSIAWVTALGLLFKRGWRLIGLMLIGWWVGIAGAIATLDTAFWHFKRYQMPLMALFVPVAAWGLTWLWQGIHKRKPTRSTVLMRYGIYGYAGVLMPIIAGALLVQYLGYHHLNVTYVYQQPYQMAQWIRDNTPTDAVIAVHDVGLMRYAGGRTTLDMVGLTTPTAAAYWRNGPGSVAEYLMAEQPDYIASYGYGHGYGLAYLADTALYGQALAEFHIDDWQRASNVALAADTQGIYAPDWDQILFNGRANERERTVQADLTSPYANNPDNAPLFTLDVGNIASEHASAYEWHATYDGQSVFISEVRDFQDGDARVIDSYRLIDAYEQFTVRVSAPPPDDALVLITRLHASARGTLDIYADGEPIDTQWIPQMPGTWVTISTRIPTTHLHDGAVTVRIVPQIADGYYMPAQHVIRLQDKPQCCQQTRTHYQNEAIRLTDYDVETIDGRLYVETTWQASGDNYGDYRAFLHLYDDRNQPPIAQWDGYISGMPIGNWIEGSFTGTMIIDLETIPSGTYPMAIGFYNPTDPTDRLIATSDALDVSADGRLWVTNVRILD